MRTRTIAGRLLARSATAILVFAALAGCASADGVADSGDVGYVSGDGSVEEFPVDSRTDAPDFGGTTADGEEWWSTDYEGRVMVVNFWYAACGPCRVEAPVIGESIDAVGDDVTFIGVNLRDSAPAALAFEETFDVPYPSILDEQEGTVQLAFSGTIVPNAVPTTIVIDSEGRVAVRISGAITESSILTTLLEDELARS